MKIIKNKRQSERLYWRRLMVKQKHCTVAGKHHFDGETIICPVYMTDNAEILLARVGN